MSIIHNALKKAQQKLSNNQGSEEPEEKNEEKPVEKKQATGEDITALYDKLHDKADSQIDDRKAPPKEPSKQKNKEDQFSVVGLFQNLLPLIIFLGIAFVLFQNRTMIFQTLGMDEPEIPNVSIPKISMPKATVTTPSSPTAAPTATINEVDYVISGISEIEGQMVAIINNDIYEKGDLIDGLRIQSISLKGVTLVAANGQEFIIKNN